MKTSRKSGLLPDFREDRSKPGRGLEPLFDPADGEFRPAVADQIIAVVLIDRCDISLQESIIITVEILGVYGVAVSGFMQNIFCAGLFQRIFQFDHERLKIVFTRAVIRQVLPEHGAGFFRRHAAAFSVHEIGEEFFGFCPFKRERLAVYRDIEAAEGGDDTSFGYVL